MHTRRQISGFTIIEMVIVLLLLGVMTAVTVPRALRTTPSQEVDDMARQLARDLEGARLRAMASKRIVRVAFDQTNGFYAAFMDLTGGRTGQINETVDEARAARLLIRGSSGGIPGVRLPQRLKFGSGSASVDPLGNSVSDPITLTDDQVDFNARGLVLPVPNSGVIMITHKDDSSAVAAVTISGSGAFRSWRYHEGEWK